MREELTCRVLIAADLPRGLLQILGEPSPEQVLDAPATDSAGF